MLTSMASPFVLSVLLVKADPIHDYIPGVALAGPKTNPVCTGWFPNHNQWAEQMSCKETCERSEKYHKNFWKPCKTQLHKLYNLGPPNNTGVKPEHEKLELVRPRIRSLHNNCKVQFSWQVNGNNPNQPTMIKQTAELYGTNMDWNSNLRRSCFPYRQRQFHCQCVYRAPVPKDDSDLPKPIPIDSKPPIAAVSGRGRRLMVGGFFDALWAAIFGPAQPESNTNRAPTAYASQRLENQRPSSLEMYAEKPQRPESLEKPQRPESLEKPQRPESFEKPQRPESPEKPERPETPEKPERPETPDKPEIAFPPVEVMPLPDLEDAGRMQQALARSIDYKTIEALERGLKPSESPETPSLGDRV